MDPAAVTFVCLPPSPPPQEGTTCVSPSLLMRLMLWAWGRSCRKRVGLRVGVCLGLCPELGAEGIGAAEAGCVFPNQR